MKTLMKTFLICLLIAVATAFTACQPDDPDPIIKTKTTSWVDAFENVPTVDHPYAPTSLFGYAEVNQSTDGIVSNLIDSLKVIGYDSKPATLHKVQELPLDGISIADSSYTIEYTGGNTEIYKHTYYPSEARAFLTTEIATGTKLLIISMPRIEEETNERGTSIYLSYDLEYYDVITANVNDGEFEYNNAVSLTYTDRMTREGKLTLMCFTHTRNEDTWHLWRDSYNAWEFTQGRPMQFDGNLITLDFNLTGV